MTRLTPGQGGYSIQSAATTDQVMISAQFTKDQQRCEQHLLKSNALCTDNSDFCSKFLELLKALKHISQVLESLIMD